jgi:HSP20 family protein
MSTVRWSSSGDAFAASRAIDRLFDQIFGYAPPRSEAEGGVPVYTLPVDVLETDDAYLLHASVPGIPAENVEVTFEDGILNLSAKATPTKGEGRWLRQERPWGNWVRKMEMPKEVDPARIDASFDNGVLTVTVPKAARAQAMKIPVSPGSSSKRELQK